MTFHRHRQFIFLLIFSFIVSAVHGGIIPESLKKKKKVLKKPYTAEYPIYPARPSLEVVAKPWVVFTDRKEANVFSDDKLTIPSGKIKFLEAFYVTSVTTDAFEIIRYNPAVLKSVNVIADMKKVEYVGWVDRNNFTTSEKAFLDGSTRLPIKYVTMLNGSKIFDNIKKYAVENQIQVFADPDLLIPVDSTKITFNEVLYVYKQNNDRLLVGKDPSFTIKDQARTIAGWIHASLAQSWGVRLCIEPKDKSPAGDSVAVLYRNKPQTANLKSGSSVSCPIIKRGCDINEQLWQSVPVFENDFFTENTKSYRVIKTGAVLNPFDKSNSYIYNSSGSKINYSKLCEIIQGGKNYNIVFAVNIDNDSREYLPMLLNTIQDLGEFFSTRSGLDSLHFGAVHSQATYTGSTSLKKKYSDILPTLINMVKGSMENKNTASSNGILNGLSNASRFFAGHEKENNIILAISTKGDEGTNDPAYKSKSQKTIDGLGKTNSKILFFQPYCGRSGSYFTFVEQAKAFLVAASERSAAYKRELQVSNDNNRIFNNDFRAMYTGTTNVYCLDFPKNATSQGFIVFPTVGDKADNKFLNEALDSLGLQIKQDNKSLTNSLSSIFNSSSLFNNSKNKIFERYYNGIMPSDFTYSLKNYNYNYFAHGYLLVQTKLFNTHYKQSLLLSKEEYEEIYTLFKGLKFDLLAANADKNNKVICYNALAKALTRYSTIKGSALAANISLAQFFYETCGHYTAKASPRVYTIDQLLNETTTMKPDVFRTMVEEINARIQAFYTLRDQPNYTFNSSGRQYYWVSEEFLP